MMKVGFQRHLAKTITWRIVGTIGGVEVFTKMFLYFIHERLWYKFSKFGVYEDPNKSTN